MNRTPPSDVSRILRQEVNYGCPIPGCGKPFLQFHHFRPPWRVKHHMNPEGMIALCVEHHSVAESYSADYLQKLKANPNSRHIVRGKFPWLSSSLIIRLGGCYTVAPVVFDISSSIQPPLLSVLRNEENILELDLDLEAEDGQKLARFRANTLEADSDRIHDLIVTPTASRVRLWLAKRRIGLDLQYSLKTLEQLEDTIRRDEKISLGADISQIDRSESWLVTRMPIEAIYGQLEHCKTAMEAACFAQDNGHPVTSMSVRWCAWQQRDSDNKVAFLDLSHCRLFRTGRKLEMRKGILSGPFPMMQMCFLKIGSGCGPIFG